MSKEPLRFCLTCRAMAVLVLAGGIAIAANGLGGTLEQVNTGSAVMVEAEPIMLFEPDTSHSTGSYAPHFTETNTHGEI
ncbi:hypothetical protein [Saliniramus sp.]|uniref:hypothetical protein n=1 Tax=Saliniramus sp. TaxID=2986772 RepID=UPI002CFE38C7|nr:hypothetical protein [Saliniramus sp.]HMB12082.1 hypothetical protein [Saliniramus sp.]